MWKQKHMFDGLYTMSRDSSSLLKEAEDKSDSCSTVNDELHKILGIIKDKEFVNARGQIVGKSSVTEKLIGCFYDVLSKGNLIEKEYCDGIEHRKQLLKDTGSLFDTEVVSEIEFAKSVAKMSKQIDEIVQKLVSLRGSILSECSPHGNITLWRVFYESSLVNLQLDLIRENLDGTIKLGVDLLKHAQLADSADLSVQKTVSEVIHMVAEVFVPRCTRKAAEEMLCSSTGIKTSDEQGLDFSFKEDADICDDVPTVEDHDVDICDDIPTGEDDDVNICDDVPTGEDDEYDWDDHVMSRRVAI
ncbi:hypothetical protein MKW92_036959 [Papaver armeniacum]|nr:hypothetical protein MKW92_036959 [Papaver armeniacum]